MNNYITISENILGGNLPEDLSLLKKKLKEQQSLFSDKIKIQSDPLMKMNARFVHNEISKLRRKTNNREGILELMQVSLLSQKIISENYSMNDIVNFNALTNHIKSKSSRAWKILGGAMISFTMVVAPQLAQTIAS